MMLPSSWVEFHCCRDAGITRFACLNGVIGTFQILFGVLCSWVVYVAFPFSPLFFSFLIFSERDGDGKKQDQG